MRRMGFVAAALAALLAAGCDRNNNRTDATKPVGTSGEANRTEVSRGDQDFVHDVAIAGSAEVELGKMAVERAANAQVKKFGQMMIDDHTKAGESLKAVASQYNIAVPAVLDDKHRDLRDKLAKLQGADFDREYMSAMVDGHEGVADKLESRVDKTKLADWKAQMKDSVSGQKVKESAEAITVTPERSDNPVTMKINQWAADTYPTVVAHLEAAKPLKDAVSKRRPTN